MKTTIKTNYSICIQCLGCNLFLWVNILNDNLDEKIKELKKSCRCVFYPCDEIDITDYHYEIDEEVEK